MTCGLNPNHDPDNYCKHCGTCFDCLDDELAETVEKYKTEIDRLRTVVNDLNHIVHDQIVVMQSALIDATHNSPEQGV